jgi:hypothetical protein
MTRKSLFVIGLGAALAAAAVSTRAQTPRPLKVYCFTQPAGVGLAERQDAVNDLKGAIAKKTDWLENVAAQKDADATLEVIGRTMVPVGRIQSSSSPNTRRQIYEYRLKAIVRAGAMQASVNESMSSEDASAAWKGIAANVADELQRWAADNQARATAVPPPPVKTVISPAPPALTSAGADDSARQAAMAWVTSARPGDPQTAGGLLRAGGATLTAAGNAIIVKGGPSTPLTKIVFETQAVLRDRAIVPLILTGSDGEVTRGSIDLARDQGSWKVSAADLGPTLRFPR